MCSFGTICIVCYLLLKCLSHLLFLENRPQRTCHTCSYLWWFVYISYRTVIHWNQTHTHPQINKMMESMVDDSLTLAPNYFPLNSRCTLASYSRSIVYIPRPFFAGQWLNLLGPLVHLQPIVCYLFDVDDDLFAIQFSSFCLCLLRRWLLFDRRYLQRNKRLF